MAPTDSRYTQVGIELIFVQVCSVLTYVSAMSSMRMAILSLASPTKTMEATSLAFFLSLWISANSTFKRSAMAVTLGTR